MKTIFISFWFLSFFNYQSIAQTEISLKQVETKLKAGENISSILTDRNFLPLHPETRFRLLIEKYASTGKLVIAPAGEPGRKIKVIVLVTGENNQGLVFAS